MNDKHFTHDEVSLMSIYNAAGTREGLIAALTEMRGGIWTQRRPSCGADGQRPRKAARHYRRGVRCP